MSVKIGLEGVRPELKVESTRPLEKDLYKQLWETKEYRVVAPGEFCAQEFLKQARPKAGSKVLDLGAGTGRGALSLALFGSLKVTMVDFANNCLDDDIKQMLISQPQSLNFIEADLTQPLPVSAEYGFCTDVMEHIRPRLVDTVLDNCLLACQHVFFQISCEEDHCGALVGHDLHLSVHPYDWWLKKFNDRDCVVHWSQDKGGYCLFYVSAWRTGQEVTDAGLLNTSEEQIKANVKINIDNDWEQVVPHETNDIECMILGGGPSLDKHLDKIKELRDSGVKLLTMNGSYNWAIENSLTPSALVMVDARQFNARFTRQVLPECKYLLASQCHPDALEGLPKERTYLWHTQTDLIQDLLTEKYKVWFSVPGGTTILLRVIPLFRMLGYRKYHLFGCDSCLSESETHHAYSQPENDGSPIVNVQVPGGKQFKCHPWMASQAQEFVELVKYLGSEIEIEIYGDGLLKNVLEVAAAESNKLETDNLSEEDKLQDKNSLKDTLVQLTPSE